MTKRKQVTMALDTLISHPASSERPARSWAVGCLIATLVALALLGIAGPRPGGDEAGILADDASDLHVLVLGVSTAPSHACPSCVTYIDQLTTAVTREEERSVVVDGVSDARSAMQIDDLSIVAALLVSDKEFSELVRSADLILLRIGDTSSVIALGGSSCSDQVGGSRCTSSPHQFDEGLRSMLAKIDTLRQPGSKRIVLHLPGQADAHARRVTRSGCDVARRSGWSCLDGRLVVPTGVVSSRDWYQPAQGTAQIQRQQDSIAGELLRCWKELDRASAERYWLCGP